LRDEYNYWSGRLKYEYWIAGAKRLRKYTSLLGIILLLPVIPASFLLLTVQEGVSPFFLIFHLCMGEPGSCYWVATCVSMTLNCLTPLPTNLYCKLGHHTCPKSCRPEVPGQASQPRLLWRSPECWQHQSDRRIYFPYWSHDQYLFKWEQKCPAHKTRLTPRSMLNHLPSGYDVSRVCCVLVTPERQLQRNEMSEDRRECDIMCYDCMCPFWGLLGTSWVGLPPINLTGGK